MKKNKMERRKKYRRFSIGDWVAVSATVFTDRDKNRKRIGRQELETLRRGQVVGLARIQEGIVEGDCYQAAGVWGEDVDWQPPYLSITKTETVWLVRFGMMNKPVKVLDGDIKPCSSGKELPILYQTTFEWDERSRALQRGIMEDQPRDEKGRWRKYNAIKE